MVLIRATMRASSLFLSFSLASFSGILAGCGGASPELTYSDSAQALYEQGVQYLNDDDYLEAQTAFTTVKNRYAYSQYAALAELKLADTLVKMERELEAIEAYRIFVQNRPSHSEVPYAMWRIGECFYKQIPTDLFLFPPAYEKDQSATQDALRNLETYVNHYPNDVHVGQAQKYILHCRTMLANYELYVAKFYLKRDRPTSARGRLEGLLKNYKSLSEIWDESAGLLLDVYGMLDLKEERAQLATRILAEMPNGEAARKAQLIH